METNGNEKSLDLLSNKYLEIYKQSKDKVSFQEKLLERLDQIYQTEEPVFSTERAQAPLTPAPFSVQIQKNENPYIQFALNDQAMHSR